MISFLHKIRYPIEAKRDELVFMKRIILYMSIRLVILTLVFLEMNLKFICGNNEKMFYKIIILNTIVCTQCICSIILLFTYINNKYYSVKFTLNIILVHISQKLKE